MKKSYLRLVAFVALFGLAVSSLPANADTSYTGVDDHCITILGNVSSTMYFEIVTTTTFGSNTPVAQTVCQLGTMVPGQVYTCSYNLIMLTNNGTGFSIDAGAVTAFSNGTYSWGDVQGGTIDGTIEEYGMTVASTTDGGITAPNTYNGSTVVDATYYNTIGVTPYAATTTLPIESYSAAFDGTKGDLVWDATSASVVTHTASPDFSTPAGLYTQVICWEMTDNP